MRTAKALASLCICTDSTEPSLRARGISIELSCTGRVLLESGYFRQSVAVISHEGLQSFQKYCKFGDFRENFIFANGVKRHILDALNSRLSHDLPISANDRVISPFHEGFIFTKLCICEVSLK